MKCSQCTIKVLSKQNIQLCSCRGACTEYKTLPTFYKNKAKFPMFILKHLYSQLETSGVTFPVSVIHITTGVQHLTFVLEVYVILCSHNIQIPAEQYANMATVTSSLAR
jgi:hypothetical protein